MTNLPNHPTTHSRLVDADIDTGIIDLVETLTIMGCKPFASCQGIPPHEATENYPDGLHAMVAMRGDVDDTALLALSEHPFVSFATYRTNDLGQVYAALPQDQQINIEFSFDSGTWVIRLGHKMSIKDVTAYLRLYILDRSTDVLTTNESTSQYFDCH